MSGIFILDACAFIALNLLLVYITSLTGRLEFGHLDGARAINPSPVFLFSDECMSIDK